MSVITVATTISKNAGAREKALRAAGSFFKMMHYYSSKHSPASPRTKTYAELSATIAEARRVYRQCRYLDAMSSLLENARRGNPSFEKLVLILRYFSLTLHYVTDQMVFLHAHGLLRQRLPNIDKWKKQSSAWWGLSVVSQLILDARQYQKGRALMQKVAHARGAEKAQLQRQLDAYRSQQGDLCVDVIKNVFDLFCAWEGAVKRGHLHNGLTGLFALISSLAGLYLAFPRSK